MEQINIDLLLKNGCIYTLREEGEKVQSVGIHKGNIVFAGTNKEAENYKASKIIDLEDKTVIPGLGDAHLHLYAHCQNLTSVKLDEVKSMDELILTMKRKAEVTEKGKWMKGAGFDQTKFMENRLPTKQDLDKISTEHPIVIRRCCLHVMVANSLAIQMACINQDVMEAYKGLIEIDNHGDVTGIFREKSTIIFDEIVPDPLNDPSEKKKIMIDVFHDMVSKGITSFNTYAAKIWNYEEDISTYKELEGQGELPLRVVVSLDDYFELDQDLEVQNKDPYKKVKYGSYKLFTDGSLGAKSAALNEPYNDDKSNYGIIIDGEKLKSDLMKAYELGLQPAIHAIGDKALDITLDAIEYVIHQKNLNQSNINNKELKSNQRLPFRIIHAQLVNKDQLNRMKNLPVILDVQPVFLCTDLYWIESRLGKERTKNSYIWKTMIDEGLLLAGGSDCPVESYDPLKGVYAAVMRQDTNGYPKGGWHPEERLTVYQAICLFTKNIAYTTGDEDVLGTIEKDKFADLVVLDKDPFEIEQEEIKDIKVLKTFVAGELVFERSI